MNGGVELALPSESKATIAARCVNGGVHVDGLEIAKEEQGNDFERRRRLNGTMNGGGAKVNMSTTNGGVRLSKRRLKDLLAVGAVRQSVLWLFQ